MTFNLETIRVTDGQKALAAYIKRETGKVVKPESIALVDALRSAFRKDPAQVAEREAVQAKARARQEAQFQKYAQKAQELADRLGYTRPGVVSAEDAKQVTVQDFVVVGDADEADDGFDEDPAPVATVTPISQARSKAEERPTVEDNPGGGAVVAEAYDAFETDGPDNGEVEDF